jgi:hypothetical protein
MLVALAMALTITAVSARPLHAEPKPVKECHMRTALEGVPVPDDVDPQVIPSIGYRCTGKDGTQYDQTTSSRYEIVTPSRGIPAVLARPLARDIDLKRFRIKLPGMQR